MNSLCLALNQGIEYKKKACVKYILKPYLRQMTNVCYAVLSLVKLTEIIIYSIKFKQLSEHNWKLRVVFYSSRPFPAAAVTVMS